MDFIGVDPGKDGGLVRVSPAGAILSKHKTPLFSAPEVKDEYDIVGVINLLRLLIDNGANREGVHFVLEKGQALPPTMGGSAANFQRGFSAGMWLAALTAEGCVHTVISPRTWQRGMFTDLPKVKPKMAAKLVVARIWPREDWAPTDRSTKPDGGFIDAALIGEFGRRAFSGAVERARRGKVGSI